MEKDLQDIAAPWGGILDPSTLTETFENLLLEPVRLADILVDGSRENMDSRWATRPLRIAFLNGSVPNAFATKSEHADYVLITIGLVESIYGTMAGMLSVPFFLPMIGTPPVGEPPRLELAGGFPPMPFLRKGFSENPIRLCWPSDPARVALALQLASMALHFTVLHEIGHIFGGHLELSEQRGMAPVIREFEDGLSDHQAVPHDQILECDADTFAAHAQSFLDIHPDSDPLWSETYGWNDVSGAHAGFIAHAVAVSVLFRLLDMLRGDGRAPVGHGSSSHPHPAVRSNLAISRSLSLAVDAGRLRISDMPALIQASLIPVEEVWMELGLPGQRLGARAIWITQIVKLSGELGQAYESSKAMLRDFARVPPRWYTSWPKPE
jgi:hypothetical protein